MASRKSACGWYTASKPASTSLAAVSVWVPTVRADADNSRNLRCVRGEVLSDYRVDDRPQVAYPLGLRSGAVDLGDHDS